MIIARKFCRCQTVILAALRARKQKVLLPSHKSFSASGARRSGREESRETKVVEASPSVRSCARASGNRAGARIAAGRPSASASAGVISIRIAVGPASAITGSRSRCKDCGGPAICGRQRVRSRYKDCLMQAEKSCALSSRPGDVGGKRSAREACWGSWNGKAVAGETR